MIVIVKIVRDAGLRARFVKMGQSRASSSSVLRRDQRRSWLKVWSKKYCDKRITPWVIFSTFNLPRRALGSILCSLGPFTRPRLFLVGPGVPVDS